MIYPYGLEVRVAWQDRTLFCRYFTQVKSIVVGGRGADIHLPIFSPRTQYQVLLPYHLKDGEEARIKLHGGLLDLYIRPLKSVPQAIAAPAMNANFRPRPISMAKWCSRWKFPDPPANQIGRVVYPFIFLSR